MAGWLDGKVALITGAASGIGRAAARRFLQEGAKVVAFDIAADSLASLTKELGENAVPVQGSVTSLEDNERAVAEAVRSFGALDIFLGNAGIFDGFRTLDEIPRDSIEAAFDEIFAVNVKGYLLGAKASYRELRRRRGCIVLTTSIAGLRAGGGGSIYTAAKHATVGLVRQLAQELAPEVRVNGVAPGGTLTNLRAPPSLGGIQGFADKTAAAERMKLSTPLGIASTPEHHMAAYVLLASDQASAITGVIIPSDAGAGVRGARRS